MSQQQTHLADVGVVERSINLIQHKEWSRFIAVSMREVLVRRRAVGVCFKRQTFARCVPVNGEEQGQCRHSLLSSRQVVHRPEAFTRSHAVIVDAIQIRFLWVLRTQERLQRQTHTNRCCSLEEIAAGTS